MKIKVEVLYFGGCPAYRTVEKTLKEVLADEGIEANVQLVAVDTDEEAAGYGSLAVRRYEWLIATSSPPQSARTGGRAVGSTQHPKA